MDIAARHQRIPKKVRRKDWKKQKHIYNKTRSRLPRKGYFLDEKLGPGKQKLTKQLNMLPKSTLQTHF